MRESDRLSGWLLKFLSAVWLCTITGSHSPVLRRFLHASPHSQPAPLQATFFFFFPLTCLHLCFSRFFPTWNSRALPKYLFFHTFSHFIVPNFNGFYLRFYVMTAEQITYCHPKESWMTVWHEKHFQKCIFSSTVLASCQNVTKT